MSTEKKINVSGDEVVEEIYFLLRTGVWHQEHFVEYVRIQRDKAYEDGYTDGHSHGHDEANDRGWENEYHRGHEDGYEEGYSKGSSEGYREGYSDGSRENDYGSRRY